jgi:hypothetical protein
MSFVDDEGGLMRRRNGGELLKWSDVPVHAEEGFGDKEPPASTWS